MPKCEDCRYWKAKYPEEDASEVGYCRRNAPSAYNDPEGEQICAYWPITASEDWCGEFKEKEEKQNPASLS